MATATALRDLAFALIWRELSIRYKRSVLGVVWALIEPLVLVLTYVLVFGFVLKANTGVDNYPLYVLFGTLAWIFFSATVEQSSTVVLDHAPLARKIAFPWEVLFVAIVVSRLSTLVLGLALGIVTLAVFGHAPSWSLLLFMPLGLVTLSALAMGIGLIVGVLQPMLRDTTFLVRYALRLGFYAVPVAYPATLVPDVVRDTFAWNPLVPILWFFQATTAPVEAAPSAPAIASAVACSFVALGIGALVFRKLRPWIADLL